MAWHGIAWHRTASHRIASHKAHTVAPRDRSMLCQALTTTNLHDSSITTSSDPIMLADVNSSGKFAFVECRTVAEATSLMALSGIELGGKSLRINRPTG